MQSQLDSQPPPLPEGCTNVSSAVCEERRSAFRPVSILSLFLRPSRFFGGRVDFTTPVSLWLAVWIYGMVGTSAAIQKQLMRAEMRDQQWSAFLTHLATHWTTYWMCILLGGVLNGLFYYWVGGWWYRTRLKWSGVELPDRVTASAVFTYSALIYCLPMLLVLLARTGFQENYLAVYNAENSWEWAFVALPLWACVTSFAGVRTCFTARGVRAVTWFLVLPLLWYAAGIALFVALLA